METGRGVPGGVAYGSEDDDELEALEVDVGPVGRWMEAIKEDSCNNKITAWSDVSLASAQEGMFVPPSVGLSIH